MTDLVQYEADYAHEYLTHLAGEGPNPPTPPELSVRKVNEIRLLVRSMINNAFIPDREFLEPAPDPAAFGVTPERGKTIVEELNRLSRAAWRRREEWQ